MGKNMALENMSGRILAFMKAIGYLMIWMVRGCFSGLMEDPIKAE